MRGQYDADHRVDMFQSPAAVCCCTVPALPLRQFVAELRQRHGGFREDMAVDVRLIVQRPVKLLQGSAGMVLTGHGCCLPGSAAGPAAGCRSMPSSYGCWY